MNYSLAVFLMDKRVRLVGVIYEKEVEGTLIKTTLYKTLDPSIKVDDLVVVPTRTRQEMTVCKVKEVDLRPDFEGSTVVDWLIGKVDPESTKDIKVLEERALEQMKDADYERRKAELQKSMGFKASAGEGLEAFREQEGEEEPGEAQPASHLDERDLEEPLED